MVDRLEDGIEKILGGAAVEDESTSVVDYTLADQNEDLGEFCFVIKTSGDKFEKFRSFSWVSNNLLSVLLLDLCKQITL